MKKTFENTRLLYVILLLLFFKVLATFLVVTSDILGSFSCFLFWIPLIIALFSPSPFVAWSFVAGAILLVSLFLVCCALLLANKKGAGFASIVLIAICGIDAFLGIFSLSSLFFFSFLHIAFGVFLVFMLLQLRKPDSEDPKSVEDIDLSKL